MEQDVWCILSLVNRCINWTEIDKFNEIIFYTFYLYNNNFVTIICIGTKICWVTKKNFVGAIISIQINSLVKSIERSELWIATFATASTYVKKFKNM